MIQQFQYCHVFILRKEKKYNGIKVWLKYQGGCGNWDVLVHRLVVHNRIRQAGVVAGNRGVGDLALLPGHCSKIGRNYQAIPNNTSQSWLIAKQ
jgi:hypothetical protein